MDHLDKLKARLTSEDLFNEEEWKKLTDIIEVAKTKDKFVEFSDAHISLAVEAEKFRRILDKEEMTLNYDKILVEWLKQVPFYQEVSRFIRKRRAKTFVDGRPNPTATVCYNLATEDIELLYNPRFFARMIVDARLCSNGKHDESQGVKEIEGITWHEYLHIVLRHVTDRSRKPMFAWNVATDAANNSMIKEQGGSLPSEVILPGQDWKPRKGATPDGLVATYYRMIGEKHDATPEEKAMYDGLSDLIKSWPKLQASDWYMEELMKWSQENSYEWGKSGIKLPGSGGEECEIDMMDLHDMWDDIPEAERPMVEAKIREMVKRGVRRADSEQNGWGNTPAWLKDAIRASVHDDIDWVSALRNWIGSVNRGGRTTSIKRINKRFPYQHPGTKRNRVPHIAVAVDQSGSVGDDMLGWIFGALGALSKLVNFTVIPFDVTVAKDKIFTWKKGSMPELKRVRCGGTCFQPVTDFVNSPENRGKFDGMLICTDGGAGEPGPSRVKRGWLLAPKTELAFPRPSGELVLSVDDPSKIVKPGAIR